MAEFKKKKKFNYWHSPIVLIVLSLFTIFFFYKLILIYGKERETNDKKNQAKQELEELKNREKIISENIAKFNTDEGIEDILREKFNVAKEGEKMVIIVQEEKKEVVEMNKKSNSFFDWITKLFK